MKTFFELIEDLIGEGFVNKAMQKLIEVLRNYSKYNTIDLEKKELLKDIILMKSKLYNIEKDISLGLIGYAEGQTEKTKTTDALLNRLTILKDNKEFNFFADSIGENPKFEDVDEEKLWSQAIRLNDLSTFQKYLRTFPNGIYSRVALECIEKLNEAVKLRMLEKKELNLAISKLFLDDYYEEMFIFYDDGIEVNPETEDIEKRYMRHKGNAILNSFKSILTGENFNKGEEIYCYKIKDEIYYLVFCMSTILKRTVNALTNQNNFSFNELKEIVNNRFLSDKSLIKTWFKVNWSELHEINNYSLQIVFAVNKSAYNEELIKNLYKSAEIVRSYNKGESFCLFNFGRTNFSKLLKQINESVEKNDKNLNFNNLFFILSELLQNINLHSVKVKDRKEILKIEKNKLQIRITTANFIFEKDINRIFNKIEYINSLSENELSAYYDYCLFAEETDDIALGLSLTSIKRLTNNNFLIDILEFNDVYKILELKVDFNLQNNIYLPGGAKNKNNEIEPLHIEATEDTPKVYFNPEINLFEIQGKSLPEIANHFYEPVLKWALKFFSTVSNPVTVDMKLDSLNTSSAKQIAKFLQIVEESAGNKNVTIRWYHDKLDLEMVKTGTRFSKLIDVNFEFHLFEE